MNLSFITKEYTVKKKFVKIDLGYYDVADVHSICRYIIENGRALIDDLHLSKALVGMNVVEPFKEGKTEMFSAGSNFVKFSDQIETAYWENE